MLEVLKNRFIVEGLKEFLNIIITAGLVASKRKALHRCSVDKPLYKTLENACFKGNGSAK